MSANIIELRFIKTKTEVSIYTIAESELCEQKMIYYSHLIPNQNNARLLKKERKRNPVRIHFIQTD